MSKADGENKFLDFLLDEMYDIYVKDYAMIIGILNTVASILPIAS